MISCGIIASRREAVYNRLLPSSVEMENKLSFFHHETIIPLIIFAIIFGCRHNVGVDYPAYLDSYLYTGNREDWEFLFLMVTETMSKLGIHYAFYFTLWAFIQVFLLFYTFRKQRFLFPYIAFFLIFGSYYLSMMNIIRQQLAACIFVYSIQYIDDKKFLKYFLSIFVASLFHKSAWLVLILYPLFQRKKDWFPNLKWQLFLYVIAVYLFTNYDLVVKAISKPFSFFTGVLGYETYLVEVLHNEKLNSAAQFGNNTGLGVYIVIFLSFVIILYSNQLKEYYDDSFFKIIYSLWFIRILADFSVGDSIILNRPFVYVYNFKIIMLAYFVNYCFKTKRKLPIVLATAFLFIHIVLFLNVISNGVVNTSMFRFFWQK